MTRHIHHLEIDAPFVAAEVRKPGRCEWPENRLAFEACALCIRLDDVGNGLVCQPSSETVAALLIGLKIGPASMPAASSHSRSARAGRLRHPAQWQW